MELPNASLNAVEPWVVQPFKCIFLPNIHQSGGQGDSKTATASCRSVPLAKSHTSISRCSCPALVNGRFVSFPWLKACKRSKAEEAKPQVPTTLLCPLLGTQLGGLSFVSRQDISVSFPTTPVNHPSVCTFTCSGIRTLAYITPSSARHQCNGLQNPLIILIHPTPLTSSFLLLLLLLKSYDSCQILAILTAEHTLLIQKNTFHNGQRVPVHRLDQDR